MVYITSWEDFRVAAEGLYDKSPNKTRWTIKYKASKGVLELKITDNVQCIKYQTKSSIILNRFEALNLSLMRKMQNRKLPIPADISTPDVNRPIPSAPPTTVASVISTGESAAAASAAKKKKPKKKK